MITLDNYVCQVKYFINFLNRESLISFTKDRAAGNNKKLSEWVVDIMDCDGLGLSVSGKR